MPPVCTCGATLPEDARFCHRCGKPQRDEFLGVEPEPESAPSVVTFSAPLRAAAAETKRTISFNDPLALRTSLLVASVASVLEITPFGGLFAPIAGGFAVVTLYQFRARQALTPGSGAKLGWITALLNALLITIFMIFKFALVGSILFDPLRESFRAQASSPTQLEALRMMSDPRYLALIVSMVWIFLFAISSALYLAGGALAARMYRQKTS